MKKRFLFVVLLISLCMFSLIVGNKVSKAYYSKTARGFYNSTLPSGIASKSLTIITGMGIGFTSYSYASDPSSVDFKNALNTYETVFVHCHGYPGYAIPSSAGYIISGNTVSSWPSGCLSSKLLYLSACYSGTSSPTYGDLPAALTQKGVETVVSFKQSISAFSSTDGIHRFNELTVTDMVYGYPLYLSMSMAQTTFIAECNIDPNHPTDYYGAPSYRIKGNGNYMIVHS